MFEGVECKRKFRARQGKWNRWLVLGARIARLFLCYVAVFIHCSSRIRRDPNILKCLVEQRTGWFMGRDTRFEISHHVL